MAQCSKMYYEGFGNRVKQMVDALELSRGDRERYRGFFEMKDCRHISLYMLMRLSRELNCDICWLIWGDSTANEDE